MQLPQTIWTLGHSTRSFDEFIAVMRHHGVEAIADVRRFPGSRRLPHFTQSAFSKGLVDQGFDYLWISQLGGRRRPSPDTRNTAWRNVSFRGYADHLSTAEFQEGLEIFTALACEKRTALMCAELLWWRCHRALISDVLKFRGVQVNHIQDELTVTLHPYTSPARNIDGRLGYEEDKGEALRDE